MLSDAAARADEWKKTIHSGSRLHVRDIVRRQVKGRSKRQFALTYWFVDRLDWAMLIYVLGKRMLLSFATIESTWVASLAR